MTIKEAKQLCLAQHGRLPHGSLFSVEMPIKREEIELPRSKDRWWTKAVLITWLINCGNTFSLRETLLPDFAKELAQ